MRYIGNRLMVLIFSALLTLFLIAPSAAEGQEKGITTHHDYYLEGVRHYNEGNFETARQLLTKSAETESPNDAACYYLGLTYLQLQDAQAAEAYLTKAQEGDPSNFWYKIRLAQFYAETGDMEKSISIYEKILQEHPKKYSIYYDIIDLYTANHQYDKALETLDRIESLRGENEATGEVRYELMLRKGDYYGALSHLTDYYKRFPSPRVALILGDLNKSMFKDTLAIKYYKEALNMDPGFSPADFGLAEAYRGKMNMKEYFPHITKFLQDPAMNLSVKTRYMKEVAITPHFVRQYKSQLDDMVNCVVNAHPEDTAALYMAGAYFLQTGRDSLGTLLFKGAVETHPDDYRANIEYVSLLYYLKEWRTLAEQAERSLHYFPEEKSFQEILPIAYWQSGEIDRAISHYQKLIESLPKRDTTAYIYYASLGDLYHEKGDNKKAYSYYNRVLRENPDYNPVLNNYAYYLCLEGENLKKAEKMSKKTILSEPDNPTYLDTYAWILYQMGEYQEAKVHIKRAMIYGGNEEATLLDHYAEILYALKEYDLAFIYWEQADKIDPSLKIGQKIAERKKEIKKQ